MTITKTSPNPWVTFYANRNNEHYYQRVSDKYSPFISTISNSILPGDKIVEFGCGLCNITRNLVTKHWANNFYALDKEIEMLKLSEQNLDRAGIPRSKVSLYLGDARTAILYGDIAHSHGLLEHFKDKDIQAIIGQQLGNFREIFHYVPSYKYSAPSFGDERLMTPDQWQDICKSSEILEFNNGYDLILRWR